MAGGAEPAAPAGESQQVLVLAVVTADAGKTVLQISAVQELVHNLRDNLAQKTVVRLVMLLICLEKCVKMPGQTRPER